MYAVCEAGIIGAFSLSRLFTFVGDLSRAKTAFASFSTWMERTPRVASLKSSSPPSGSLSDLKASGGSEIVFQNVDLVYPSRKERPAIQQMSLVIRAGQKVAFCGKSDTFPLIYKVAANQALTLLIRPIRRRKEFSHCPFGSLLRTQVRLLSVLK